MDGFWEFIHSSDIILVIFLHLILVIPMFFIYKKEKARLEQEDW